MGVFWRRGDDGISRLDDDPEAPANGGSSPFVGGTLTEPTVVDTPDVFSRGGVDRKFAVIDQQHEITIDWDYDGATNLTATISGGYPGVYASLAATDDDSSVPNGYFDVSGDLVLAITNVGFESGGPNFDAHVYVPFGQLGDTSTTQSFAVGTAATRTVSYRPASFAFEQGMIARSGILMYGNADGFSPSIKIVPPGGAPGADGTQPLILVASADGLTSHFVLNRVGGITITTSDNSPPIILPNVPTEDPHIPGALWSDSGVVTMSDGITPP